MGCEAGFSCNRGRGSQPQEFAGVRGCSCFVPRNPPARSMSSTPCSIYHVVYRKSMGILATGRVRIGNKQVPHPQERVRDDRRRGPWPFVEWNRLGTRPAAAYRVAASASLPGWQRPQIASAARRRPRFPKPSWPSPEGSSPLALVTSWGECKGCLDNAA